MKDLKHMPRNSNLQVKFFHYLEKLLYAYMENLLNAEKIIAVSDISVSKIRKWEKNLDALFLSKVLLSQKIISPYCPFKRNRKKR